MKCDIVIAVWNKKELTRNCIESIARNTHSPYRLIIIDNASDEPAKSYLEGLKNDSRLEVTLIRNQENLGNTLAVNQGLRASGASFVCNLDNDIIVTRGWLDEMIAVAQKREDIGLVIPSPDQKRLVKSPSVSDIEEYAASRSVFKGEYVELGGAVGYCVLIKRKVIETIGVWDERFSPGYFDDAEYSARAQKAGFLSVCARAAFVYHKEHGSFNNKHREELFRKNRQLFHRLHGEPQRFLYVVDGAAQVDLSSLQGKILEYARKGNWVWVFTRQKKVGPTLCRHGNVRQFEIPDSLFTLKVILRIIKRQKKKFNHIYVMDKTLHKILCAIRCLHKAEVELLT